MEVRRPASRLLYQSRQDLPLRAEGSVGLGGAASSSACVGDPADRADGRTVREGGVKGVWIEELSRWLCLY